jgi:hypothetical protein
MKSQQPSKAHQRVIREEKGRQVNRPAVPLSLCRVEPITLEQAEAIILEYEWLGTMPVFPRFAYGMIGPDDEILGASVFSLPPGSESNSLCGDDYRDSVICLARGACAPWTEINAPSFQTARSCQLAYRDHGYKIFFGYSDSAAGEIGTIYQACNWIYIGRPRSAWRYKYTSPDGEVLSSRAVRRRMGGIRWEELESLGWSRIRDEDKARYVWFEGSKTERKRLRKALKYPAQPYPKRPT